MTLSDLDRLIALGWGEWPADKIPLVVRFGLSDQRAPSVSPEMNIPLNNTPLSRRVRLLESRMEELMTLSRRMEERAAVLGALEERLAVMKPPAAGEAR